MKIPKFMKKVPPWAWIALGILIVLNVVGGLAGWGKLTSTEEALTKTKKERATFETMAMQASETAETWRKAATSKKRIRVRKTVALAAGNAIRNADGTVAYNETFEELTSSEGSSGGSSAGSTIALQSGQTIISSSEYEQLLKKKTEKSNLRFFAGPSVQIGPDLPTDYKRWGIMGGGRLLWRAGAAFNVTAEGTATGALNIYF